MKISDLIDVKIDNTPPQCDVCEDSRYLTEETPEGRIFKGHCKCQVPIFNEKVWKYIYDQIPAMIRKNLSPDFKDIETAFRPSQLLAAKKLGKKNWIYGKSGVGKTLMTFENLRRRLKNEKNKFIRARYYYGEDFDKLFIDQYGDKGVRAELESMRNLDLIIIDDIDKIGGMTEHKGYKLLNLFHTQIGDIPNIEITSNCSIKDFCSRIKDPTVSEPLNSRLIGHITPNEVEVV